MARLAFTEPVGVAAAESATGLSKFAIPNTRVGWKVIRCAAFAVVADELGSATITSGQRHTRVKAIGAIGAGVFSFAFYTFGVDHIGVFAAFAGGATEALITGAKPFVGAGTMTIAGLLGGAIHAAIVFREVARQTVEAFGWGEITAGALVAAWACLQGVYALGAVGSCEAIKASAGSIRRTNSLAGAGLCSGAGDGAISRWIKARSAALTVFSGEVRWTGLGAAEPGNEKKSHHRQYDADSRHLFPPTRKILSCFAPRCELMKK
tara:strand:- start:1317 stop:2111 length:795 start_codon:yes stop_codon:yes gene_type:complete